MRPVIEAQFGPNFPRRGNAFSRAIGRVVLRLMGWTLVGEPPNVKKMIIVAAPHTSNWDGVLLLIAMVAAGLDLRWVGKHTLFKGPLGRLLLWMGGVSVNRSQARDFVDSVVQTYAERDSLALVIAPEGTRKRTARWKSGFHRIAQKAEIPIVCGFMDYANKRVGFGPGLEASEDFGEYIEQLKAFLADKRPRNPENFVFPD